MDPLAASALVCPSPRPPHEPERRLQAAGRGDYDHPLPPEGGVPGSGVQCAKSSFGEFSPHRRGRQKQNAAWTEECHAAFGFVV